MGARRCSNPDLSTMHTFRTCDGTGLSAEWDDRCRTLLLLCSGWQQVCVERKCLIGCTPAKTPYRRSDTVGEITIRRQKPHVLRIMVEQGRTKILFLSGLTPRCEQIFPHRCCFQPVRPIRQQMGRTRACTIRAPSWRGNGQQRALRTGVSVGQGRRMKSSSQ